MNLGNILRILGRRALLIAAFTLAGVTVAGFTQIKWGEGGFVPKVGRYRASVQLLLDTPRLAGPALSSNAIRMLLLPHTQAEVIMTQAMATDISDRVGGVYDELEIAESLHAFGVVPTQVLQIDVEGDSPEDAVLLAKAAAAAYQNWLAESQEEALVPEDSRLAATVIEEPNVDHVLPQMAIVSRWLIFGGVAGATLGIVFAFGLPVPDPRQKKTKKSRPSRGAVPAPPGAGSRQTVSLTRSSNA